MMDRKTFLKLGTAGMAGLASGSISLQPAPRPASQRSGGKTGTLKKGFMLELFPSSGEYTLLEKFEMLRDAGFDGVEPSSGLNRSEVLRARDATGLDIPSVVVSTHWSKPLTSPDPSVREEGLQGVRTALEDAAEFGAGSILLVPGVVTADVSYDTAWKRSREQIYKLLAYAGELGVVIAVENVWNHFLLSPMEAASYIDEFESPWVGWYLDVGNIINFGWAHHWIRILGDRIVMTHIKEFSRTKRDEEGLWRGFDVNLMEGDNQWPEIIKAFREVGYSGYGIAEPPYRDEDIPEEVWLREYVSGRMDEIFNL